MVTPDVERGVDDVAVNVGVARDDSCDTEFIDDTDDDNVEAAMLDAVGETVDAGAPDFSAFTMLFTVCVGIAKKNDETDALGCHFVACLWLCGVFCVEIRPCVTLEIPATKKMILFATDGFVFAGLKYQQPSALNAFTRISNGNKTAVNTIHASNQQRATNERG